MKHQFLCDVHISYKIAKFLETKGYKAIHINKILEGFNTTDAAISEYANENNYIVVTKDIDFKNSHIISGKPRKVLRITLGNISNQKLIAILDINLETILDHFTTEKCFIEIGDGTMEVFK